MKKLIALTLTLLFAITGVVLTGCGGQTTDAPEPAGGQEQAPPMPEPGDMPGGPGGEGGEGGEGGPGGEQAPPMPGGEGAPPMPGGEEE